jgi:hypothetical protein
MAKSWMEGQDGTNLLRSNDSTTSCIAWQCRGLLSSEGASTVTGKSVCGRWIETKRDTMLDLTGCCMLSVHKLQESQLFGSHHGRWGRQCRVRLENYAVPPYFSSGSLLSVRSCVRTSFTLKASQYHRSEFYTMILSTRGP